MLGGFGASEFGNTNLFMATRMRITAVSDPAAIPIISPVVSEEECDVPGDVFVEPPVGEDPLGSVVWILPVPVPPLLLVPTT